MNNVICKSSKDFSSNSAEIESNSIRYMIKPMQIVPKEQRKTQYKVKKCGKFTMFNGIIWSPLVYYYFQYDIIALKKNVWSIFNSGISYCSG